MTRMTAAYLSSALVGLAALPSAVALDSAAFAAQVPPQAAPSEFPDEWFWNTQGAQARFAPMRGKEPPPLVVRDWIGEPQSLEALKGKVVVVDFWATWCGPCMRALPELNALAKEFKDDLVVIGVHDSKRGVDRFAGTVKDRGIAYPTCVDDAGQSARAWKVSFWPTVAVIDRAGKLRAIGVIPGHTRSIIEALLGEEGPKPAADADTAPAPAKAPAKPATESPSGGGRAGETSAQPSAILVSFVEGGAARARAFEPLIQKDPPALAASEWLNSDPLTLESLKGKVVVLDFWATWCGPCLQSIPHNNQLARKYADTVVLIGLCHPRGGENMAKVVQNRGIEYPVCRLADDALIKAYGVNGFPDYFLIDKEGRLRVPDCANGQVESAIEMLVRE